MKLILENWNKFLNEAAMGMDDLPPDTVVVVNERKNSETEIYYSSLSEMGSTDTKPYGRIIIEAPFPAGTCDGAWNVANSDADQGWGPMLYDIAIEWATQNANGLMADRSSVEQEAENVWNFYLKNRKDVTAHQVGDENCNQEVAGDDFENSSLSKRYTKKPTTMDALAKAEKLTTENGEPYTYKGSKFKKSMEDLYKKQMDNYAGRLDDIEDEDDYDDMLFERCQKGYKTHPTRKTKKMFGRTYRNCVKAEGMDEEEITEADPKKGTGKKPKGSGRRLYTDENPKDTVSVKFRTVQDIKDTLSKESFKSKSHKRQSQIINLIHQRARAAYQNAKDPDTKARLKKAFDYAKQRKEASKRKTQRMKKTKKEEIELSEKWSDKERKKRKSKCDNPKGFTMKQFCKNQRTKSKKGQRKN